MTIQNILLSSLQQIPQSYFTLSDIVKFYQGNLNSLPVILSRLSKKGTIKKIRRGYFTFDLSRVDHEALACAIKKNSYISLESALYHHGLLDQIPQTITLITSSKSQTISCKGKILEYSHIKRPLFFGYEIVEKALIASKEKALLDELYLISLKKRYLTINKDWFKMINKTLFKQWLKAYPSYTINLVRKLFQ